MLPAQRNKVDISKLTEEEQKLFKLYGKLPAQKSVLSKMQKDRKFFDSGDYAMSKAGKAPKNSVGTAIPNPENIPHSSPSPALNTTPGVLSPGSSPSNPLTSPIKEHPNSHPVIHPSSLSQEGTTPETTQKAAVEAPISVGTDNAGPDSTAKDAEMEI